MKVVPQTFYQHPRIENILVNGLSCVLLKNVQYRDLQNQRYVASHALILVLNGTLQIETPEGELTIINRNQIIFLPKGLYMISDIIPKNESFEAVVFFLTKKSAMNF